MRHFSRRTMTGGIEIVDSQFDFVRAVLPYDYRFTSNAQQWDEAERICQALEGPMSAQGVVTVIGKVSGKVLEGNQARGMPEAICHACGMGYKCMNVDCPNVKPNPMFGHIAAGPQS